ncbi:ATPase, T2SS/T4P/T4SS family [Verrucosispora sp. NA02020]|uniref:ATPase, T2SS/T4P/T4SS family n=1 Tax=Verrucosispora sp. NA02020 TaxID=2742132 RepID=UPI003D71163F
MRPYAAIRRHTLMDVSLEDLRDRYGAMDELICQFLKAAMAAGLNIMVAGLADAGKTTLLRGLAQEIPDREQFVTLEESRELGLHTTGRHRWAMSLEAREGHGTRGPDGRPAGEVTITDMIPLTLRMSVQRIIVGEVRSREIVPMLQAMATSKGSLCTIHARHPRAVMDRVIELALQHGPEMTAELARRMAAGAIDLIVCPTPNLIRDAIEYTCHERIRTRDFHTGRPIAETEAAISDAQGLRPTLALALLSDHERVGELHVPLQKLHHTAPRVVAVANRGAHGGTSGDLAALVTEARAVVGRLSR